MTFSDNDSLLPWGFTMTAPDCSRIALVIFMILCSSCASQKAVVDRSAMEKIFWPGPPEKPRIVYLWKLSIPPDAEGRLATFLAGDDDFRGGLLRPYSIFLDEQGIIYSTDPAAYRVTIIDPKSGDCLFLSRAAEEDFLSPIGVVAARGKTYVSDSVRKKVYIFGPDGRKEAEFEGVFQRPTALALDSANNRIYVSDTLAHIIYQYDLKGKKVNALGRHGSEEGEFNFPTHLWVDRTGRLYVTDALNFRIQIFSSDGKFERMFGMLGDAYGDLDKPKGIAADSEGNIYIVDSIHDTVKIFDQEGKLLLFFGERGESFGQLWLPSGIFIDANDHIYVADTYNGRIQVFKYLGSK